MLTNNEIRAYEYLVQIESLINAYEHYTGFDRPMRFSCVKEELNRAMQDLKWDIGSRLIEEWKLEGNELKN